MENKLLETIKKNNKEFIEKGADLEHDRWAKWQEYLFSKCRQGTMIGSLEISARDVERWTKQINTSYEDLSKQEKESDRKEVRKYMPLLQKSRIKELRALVEEVKRMRKDNYLPKGLNKKVKEAVENWKEGYDKALDDFEEILQSTINQLKS